MFGYIVADRQELTEEAFIRYRAGYCGLCRELHRRHGLLARFTLTYDMTFLDLLLQSLYESEEESGEEACIAHPFKKHPWHRDEFTAYAADMTMVLSYLKCRDDWDDDCDTIKLLESQFLKKSYREVFEKYPRQCVAIKDNLDKLSELENSGECNPDVAALYFGNIMGEIFVYYEDRWAPILRNMGIAMGKLIYIMDAVLDLEKDKKKGSYNPLINLDPGVIDGFKPTLDMLAGESVFFFDKLPIVENTDVLKNIMCSGIWTEYNRKFHAQEEGEKTDDSGSV